MIAMNNDMVWKKVYKYYSKILRNELKETVGLFCTRSVWVCLQPIHFCYASPLQRFGIIKCTTSDMRKAIDQKSKHKTSENYGMTSNHLISCMILRYACILPNAYKHQIEVSLILQTERLRKERSIHRRLSLVKGRNNEKCAVEV